MSTLFFGFQPCGNNAKQSGVYLLRNEEHPMAFPNLRRVERGRGQWQDGEQDRKPDEGRDFSGQGSQEEEFGRRGWQPGSDYHGDSPERYGERGYGAGEYRERGYADRSHDTAGRQSFNDRWQNSYGGGDPGSEQSRYGESGRYGRSERNPYRDVYSPHYVGSQRPGSGNRFSSESGPFRGRGPKDYQRSDERIREDACECLMDDDRIDASDIEVTVKDCEVTLSGSVESREQKRRAEDLIERLSGVKDVNNSLRVVTRAES
jgi:hypothetical protein